MILLLLTGKPDKPGVPECSHIDNTKIKLAWKAPRKDGGSEITNYVVELREEGAFKWKAATKDMVVQTSFIAMGLTPKTAYEFRVAAQNKAGTGPYSENTVPVKAEEKIGEAVIQNSSY